MFINLSSHCRLSILFATTDGDDDVKYFNSLYARIRHYWIHSEAATDNGGSGMKLLVLFFISNKCNGRLSKRGSHVNH